LADRELANWPVQIPVAGVKHVKRRSRAAAQLRRAVEERHVGAAKPDIVENGEPRRKTQLLCDQAKAKTLGVLWTTHHNLVSADGDGAVVRLQQPHQDFDECTLARAILAADGVDLAGRQIERDAREGADAFETFT
jgi:hypothetical protein